jgi:hypothetical protein
VTSLTASSKVLLAGFFLALVAVLGGCASGKTAGGSATTSTTATTASTTTTTPSTTTSSIPVTGPSLATIAGSKTVTVGGKKVAVPTDSGKAIPPDVGDGQQIIITVGGFLPKRLYATPSAAVVWTNLTDQPQQVVFDHFAVHSQVIPPGGHFSWTSQDSESIAYHSVSGMHAVLVLNPPGV